MNEALQAQFAQRWQCGRGFWGGRTSLPFPEGWGSPRQAHPKDDAQAEQGELRGGSSTERTGAKQEQHTDSWVFPDWPGALTCPVLRAVGNMRCWALSSEGRAGFQSRRAHSLSPLLQGGWKPIRCSTMPAARFLGRHSCVTAVQGKLSGASS